MKFFTLLSTVMISMVSFAMYTDADYAPRLKELAELYKTEPMRAQRLFDENVLHDHDFVTAASNFSLQLLEEGGTSPFFAPLDSLQRNCSREAIRLSMVSQYQSVQLTYMLGKVPEGESISTVMIKKTPKEIYQNAMRHWSDNPKLATQLLVEASSMGSRDAKRQLEKIRKTQAYKNFEVFKISPDGALSKHAEPSDIGHHLKLEEVKTATFDYFAGEKVTVGFAMLDEIKSSPHAEVKSLSKQSTNPQKKNSSRKKVPKKERNTTTQPTTESELEIKGPTKPEAGCVDQIVDETKADSVPGEIGNDAGEGELGKVADAPTDRPINIELLRKLNGANACMTAHTLTIRAKKTLERKPSRVLLGNPEDVTETSRESRKLVRTTSVPHLHPRVEVETSETESELSRADIPEEEKFRAEGSRDRDLKKLKKLLSNSDLRKLSHVKINRSIVLRALRELGPNGRGIVSWNYERPNSTDESKIVAKHVNGEIPALVIHLHARKRTGKWYDDRKIRRAFLEFVGGCDSEVEELINNIRSK